MLLRGAFFYGNHKFPYRSLLLSTTVLNDKSKYYLHFIDKIINCSYITEIVSKSKLDVNSSCALLACKFAIRSTIGISQFTDSVNIGKIPYQCITNSNITDLN